MMKHKNWRDYHRALIPLLSPHQSVEVSNDQVKRLVKNNNMLFARWVSNFDCSIVTPFWYIINDKIMSIDDYSSNTRNQIKKGLKKFYIRRIQKKVVLEKGYEIYYMAYASYNSLFKIQNRDEFILDLDGEWDFWGVYVNDILVGFSKNRIIDNCCDYSTIKILPEYMKDYAFYALIFTMNDYYLNERSLRYVSDGTRSIAHDSNVQELLIRKFGFRKAYCKLELCYHPLVYWIVMLLFPFRGCFRYMYFNFFLKIFVVMKQEEIKRLSDRIFNGIIESKSTLVLSNGNFKSGSTWVTAIIKEILCQHHLNFPNKYQNPKYKNWVNIFKIPEFLSSSIFDNNMYWVSKSHIFNQNIINRLMVLQRNIKVIHIDRDLRDVLVSHFHHLRNAKKIRGSFHSYFYNWGKYKAIQYMRYNRVWEDAPCLKISYEELKKKNYETINKIARYLHVDITDVQIEKIQKDTDIDEMRANADVNRLNEQEWFYRSGTIGDWKDCFNEDMLSKLRTIESGRISSSERIMYFVKFTLRIRIKFFLYRFSPLAYRVFDKRF